MTEMILRIDPEDEMTEDPKGTDHAQVQGRKGKGQCRDQDTEGTDPCLQETEGGREDRDVVVVF